MKQKNTKYFRYYYEENKVIIMRKKNIECVRTNDVSETTSVCCNAKKIIIIAGFIGEVSRISAFHDCLSFF